MGQCKEKMMKNQKHFGHRDHPVARAQDPSEHCGADSALSVPELGDPSV